ncbi:hypothetical protein D3C76_385120 [compost metagenome]
MKISRGFALATLMTLAASPVFAFNLSDAANAVSAMQNNGQDETAPVTAAPGPANLLNTLGTDLKITPEQAIGGTGALLGLAKNQLSATDYAELSKSVPGLDMLSGMNALAGMSGLGALLGKNDSTSTALSSALEVKDTDDLNTAFSALGMDTGMIGMFAPVILQYLGQQGVAGSLLQSLSGVWGLGGTTAAANPAS